MKSQVWAALWLLVASTVFQSCAGRRADRKESAASYGSVARPDARPMSAAEMEREIHDQVNHYRRSRGLSSLVYDPALARAARDHSRSMARRSRISHDGFSRRFRGLQPAGFRGLAENVAMNLGHADPPTVAVVGWIRSPGHHKNMTASSRPYTGIGVCRGDDGGYYFTQLFGER